MFNPINWLLPWFKALNDLLGTLRNTQSNTRWFFSLFPSVLAWIIKRCAALSRPARLHIKGHAKQWGVAFLAYETLFISLMLLLNLATLCTLLPVVGPTMARGEFKPIVVLILSSALLCWSIRWSVIHIQHRRKTLQRYWPTLNALQKLQASVTFNAVCTLVALITVSGVQTVVA